MGKELEAAFGRHRRELHVHCHRMLASYDDAEDAVQEAYLRAWRGRDGFDGVNARAWLYRIATHVCVDRSRARQRRVAAGTEVTWLTAYPDTLLDEVPDDAGDPDREHVARETIELAFRTALQVLPARHAALRRRTVAVGPAVDGVDGGGGGTHLRQRYRPGARRTDHDSDRRLDRGADGGGGPYSSRNLTR
jgi:RNA polymerase sigma-70 factor (ECF subfamily)